MLRVLTIHLCLVLAVSILLVYASTDTAQADTKDRIMRVARSYSGHPYGHGPNGFTCSEYTSIVYRKATNGRVVMPSWDDKQTRYGKSLGKPLRPERGALVWFHEPGYGSSFGRATHVAVADGRGGVWQSSSYYGLVMHLENMYLIGGYKGARRIR